MNKRTKGFEYEELSKKYLIIEQIKTFIQEELMKIEKLVISF